MTDILLYLGFAVCGAVLIVLALGLGGFGSGKARPRFQQKMMRWRVGLQLVAVLLMVLFAVLTRAT